VTATTNVTAPSPPFTNTTWEWTVLETGANQTVVASPAKYTIVFTANGTYGINADCNVGGGDYTLDGSALALAPPITTLVWCGNESQDRLFLGSLANVSSYAVEGDDRLVLNLAGPGERMVFTASGGPVAPGNVTAPFVNATWRWIARSGSESIRVPAPDRYTIAFAPNGTCAIRADCNTGSGTFTVNASKVTVAPPAMTEVYCGDDSLDTRFLGALGRVTAYEVDATGRLVLVMTSPTERLTFEKTG
jgi:heat shock protein HslJ